MNRISTTILFPFQKRLSLRLVAFALFLSGTALSQTTTQTYSVPGAATFSVPPGINKVTVKAWGGGGGGGGADSNGTENRAGGGGGGGAFVLNNNVTVTPGANITVTVGAGGTAGTNPTAGGTGGTSTFASVAPVNAPGGVGGVSGLPADRTGNGGGGGTGTNNGGAGADAPNGGGPDFNATGSGGGGGAGGETGAGGNASGITAGAGGTGGGGAGAAGLASAGNGNAGNIPGGGGSGGWDNLGNIDRTGGAGARGEVVVSYTQATAAFTRLTPAGALTNATSVTFRVTFSASVTGIDLTDFAKTGAANGTLSSVANITATTVDVILTGVSGNGNLGLDFAGGATNIINADGNIVNLTPTTDEEYTIDTTLPTVVLSDNHPDAIVRDADNVTITATFTEANGLSGTPTITIGSVVIAQPMTGGPLIWTYAWDVPAGNENPANVTVAVNDNAGNAAAAPTGKTAYNIDNTAPIITSVTSNATAAGTLKIGDQIIFTADIQITEPGLTLAPTNYNGGTLTWSTSNGGDTYTATYTVASGHTDRLSALQLTGVTATDVAGNTSGAVAGSDVAKLIDANNPPAFTTGAVTTVTVPVVTGYWNASNTALDVTIPIPGDVGGQFSLVGGTVQIRGRVAANPFVDLGSAATINGGEPGTNKTISITAAQFEALTGFANGQVAQLTAIITDAAGNSTTGTTSATSITIDQNPPAAPAAFSGASTGGNVVANYWNSHNTGVTLPVVIPNQSDLLNGTVEVEAGTVSSGTFATIATTSSATISAIATTKNITMNAAAIASIAGYAQGQLLRFRVRIIDIAGNSGPYTITTNSLTVDTTPPTITGTPAYSANGANRETIVINFSETINLVNAALPVTTTVNGNPGFYSNQPQIRTGGLTAYTSAGNFITLQSNANGEWSSPVSITYTSNVGTAGNYIRDAAGNELTTVTVATDSPAPVLASGMVLNPNGAGNETITFTVDAALNTPTTANAVTGITVDADGPGAGLPVPFSGTYSTTGNVITLTSSSNGLWTTITTVSYAAGNLASSGGTPMAPFGPEPILLAPSITSDNPNPLYATSLGTPNVVTITFTSARTLTALPTVFIDPLGANLAATVTPAGGPFTGPFTATATMTAGVTEGTLTFSITALETGKSTTTTFTTDNTIVIFDKTPPAPPSIPDLAAADDSGINNDNYTNITTNLTFSGTCENNAIVEIFNNVTPLGTAITTGTSWTIDLSLAAGTYSINATATDAASNKSVASGNLALTIDTTPPGVTSVSLPDANPNNTASVNFTVVFSEAVTGVDATDFSAYGSASTGTSIGVTPISPTTYTVTVSGITLTGLIGLDVNDNNSIIDLATNPLGGPGVAAPFFSSATQYNMILPEPPNHVTGFNVGTITPTSISLTWTDAIGTPSPTGYLISASRTGSPATPPADFGTPIANQTDLVNNTTGYINVSFGSGSYTFNNLLAGKDYIFNIYPYTNSGANIDFKINGTVPSQSVATPTALLSSLALNSTPVPISSIKNTSGNSVNVMQFTISDDGQDPIVPNVMSLQLNGVSQETVTFTLREELTLAEGASVTGFSTNVGPVASAIYTGKGTTNTITLRSPANNSWNGATTINYSGTGNAEFLTLGKMQAINAHPIAVGAETVVPFSVNGNFIVPAGVTSIQVEAWGAGGSAGGWDSYYGAASQGGGGGAYSRSLLQVSPGANYTITIGPGGAPVTTATTNLTCCIAGNNGGSTVVTGPGGTVQAQGGFGGQSSAYYAFYGTPGAGGFGLGAGGNAASGIGDVKFSGGTGGAGGSNTTGPGAIFPPAMTGNIGGSGGSSAGTNANGNNGTGGFVGPCFGCFYSNVTAPAGGGAGGGGREGSNGTSGFIPGGGGGGTNVALNGAGANGQVRITYSSPSLTGTSDWASDNAPFKFTKLVITQGDANNAALANWQDVIAGAELFDGTTTFPATSVNPTNITFDVIPSTSAGDLGFIPDAVGAPSSKTYTLRIWLRDDLNNTLAGSIDGLNLDFKVDPSIAANLVYDDITNGNQQSSRLVGTQPAIESGASSIEVVATQLDFTTSPNPAQLVLTNVTSTSISPDFLTRPRIRARDANGNTDINYTASITLSNTGVIPVNPNPISMVNGIGTFPVGFQYQDAGDGTLTATSSTAAANSLIPASGNSTPVTVSYSSLSTLQPGVFTTPATFSSLNTAGFVQVFDFRVVDDNGAGGDGSPTRISQIVYTQGTGNDIADWSQAISQAQLWDGLGVNPPITGTIGTNTITFSGINTTGLGFVGDNATKNYRLYITLKPILGGTLPDDIDNRNFVFEVLDDNISLNSQSSLFTGTETVNSGASNIAVNVIATKLQFDTNPAAVLLVGKDISLQPPVPVVEALDANNNRDLNYNSATVTVTNSLGLTMTNSPGNASIVSGLLTFPNDFRFNTTGSGATLTVASTGPSAVTNTSSTAFDVRGGNATTITAGALVEPLIISSIVDLTHTPAGLAVFDFNINDDPGGTPPAEDDGNATQLSSIFITSGAGNTIPDWTQAIETATLSDGTNTVTVTTIDASNYLYFDLSSPTGQLLGLVADNATKTYVLTLWLKTALGGTLPTTIDGLRFVFDVQKANIALATNSTNFSTAPQTVNSGAGNNRVDVIATQIDFTTPTGPTAFASLNSPFGVVAQARDVNANRDLDFTSAIVNVTNALSATMLGTSGNVIGTAGSGIQFNTTPFVGGTFTFPADFQFTSGNNNDDVTLSMTAGSISTVPFPAPFTPQIILQSSFESSIVADPTFIIPSTISYISYQEPSNIQNSTTSYELLRSLLVDGSRGSGFTYGGQPLNTITDSGDGFANSDLDGAPTTLTSLTLRIYNPSNLRRIALYGNGIEIPGTELDVTAIGAITPTTPFYDFVWNGSPLLTAPDNSISVISVRVSFRNTAPEVTDQDDIQIQLIAATAGTGSKFFNGNPVDSGIGIAGNPGPFIGGKTQPATPGSVGKIDVVATSLDFITQGSLYTGTTEPVGPTYAAPGLPTTSAAIVRARDIFENLDLDFDFPVSAISITSAEGETLASPAPFIDGILDLDGLRYTVVGDGTLQIIVNGVDSANPPPANVNAIPGSLVNVVNVTATLATNGVLTSNNIKGGSVNAVLFGVTFTPDNNSQTTAEPSLKRFIFTFDKPYESSSSGVSTVVFKNFNVTESTSGSYAGSTTVTLSGATITKGATPATASLGAGNFDQIIVDWGVSPPRNLYDPLTGSAIPRSYFLVADVDATANISTPSLQPKLIDAGWNTPNDTDIVTTKGTAIAQGGVVEGNVYQFASTRPPVLLANSSVPFSGQLNVDPGITFIDLAFDVPVVSLDGKAELFDRGTNTKVADLIARAPGNFTLSDELTSTVNPIRFDIVFLPGFSFQPDGVYYVVLEKGTFDNPTRVGKGISDSGLNYYGGISSNGIYFFKISSPNPPALFGAVSTFNNTSIGTFSTTFDQAGTAHYLVLTTGSPAPTTPEILNPGTYSIPANIRASGNYTINQVNTAQTVTFPASLALNTTYDVWIFARNNAQPTPIPVTGPPYGGSPSFAIGGTGPTLKITVPSVASNNNQPVYSLCPDSYINLTAPIILGEANNSDFFSASQQDFYMLLPTGYQFDGVNKPSVQLNGSDFNGPATVSFINNTLVRIAYTNNGSSSRDNIVITNLRVLGVSGSNPGSIVRFAGTNTLGTNTTLASISLFPSNIQRFINSYAIQNTFISLTTSSSVTAIPDNYDDTDPLLPPGAIRLIPQITPANDYGASFFSGTGVTDDKLTLSAVSLNTAFDITMTRNDPNGCLSENSTQYLVYDHRSPISPKLGTAENGTKQAIYNPNFPSAAPTPVFVSGPGPTSPTRINNDDLAGYRLIQLDAALPANNSSQIMSVANGWQSIVNGIPILVHSIPTTNIPSLAVNNTAYREYQWDYSKILNATSSGVSVNPYDNFRSSLISGNTFWRGGSLGRIEFTGTFQSTADFTVIVPFRQNVEMFVPAIPIIEIGSSNQASFDPSDGTLNTLDGLTPAQHIKSILYTNPNGYQGTPIFCEANGSITLTGSPNATPGTSTGTFGVYDYKAFNFSNNTGTPLASSSPTGPFTDNGNGTATLNPAHVTIKNGFEDILITYTYQENNSPAIGIGYLVIRISPNPVPDFTTSLLCEDIDVQFTDATGGVAGAAGVSVNKWLWDFSDPNSASNSATVQNPIHRYNDFGVYPNVSLSAETNYGCRSVTPAIKSLNVGGTPFVAFTLRGVSTADAFEFISSSTTSPNDPLASLDWTFGNTQTGTGSPASTTYAVPGKVNVNLRVTSQIGCTNNRTKEIVVLDRSTPTDQLAYEEKFESSGGNWQTLALPASPTPSSWEAGTPTTSVIQLDPAQNGNGIWKTNLTGSYNAREISALYSPSFDLSLLDRPMISLNTFRQLAAGEGVVLEFSIDNKNVADSTKQWAVLGKLNNQQITGVGWYNGIGLSSQPGNQTSGFGWTGQENNWRDSKHVLDTVLNQSQVVFRFALATQTGDPTLDGFAIDNVRVGNRTRTILVENFKNAGRSASTELSESNVLKNFKNGAIGTRLVKINYHVGFPQVDPFNQDNPADPSSRALYYNIASTPLARLDGGHAPGAASQPFSQWGSAWYDEQTLKLANARITPMTLVDSLKGSISIDVDVEAISIDLPANTILHVAVVEKLVTGLPTAKSALIKSGETEFEFVLKKLLPSGAGTVFGQPLVAGTSRNFTGFTWTPEPTRMYPNANDLAVIAFVQNDVTKEVYQAEIVDVGADPDLSVITGLGDIAPTSIEVYPNPANKDVLIKLPAPTMQSISVELIDQVGKIVHGTGFSIGDREKALNIEEYAAGIYILQLRDSKGSLIRKKLMITH